MKSDIRKERLDVDKKIVGLAVFGVVCGLLLVIFVNFSINIASGVRAYVGGEGHWTKAQKKATIHLLNYINTRNPSEYEGFEKELEVNLGDKIGRIEVSKEDFDYETVRQGFLQGNNHPEDVPHMIMVYRLFEEVPVVERAISTWEKGDQKIEELMELGEVIHTEIESGNVDSAQVVEWSDQLVELDRQLNKLEVEFSSEMGDAARLVGSILRWSTIGIGLLLLFTGGFLSMRLIKSTERWADKLKESEQKFKNVLSNSRDVVYQMNLRDKSYSYVSPSVENMFGYSQEEFLEGGYEFVLSLIHPEDVERMENELESLDQKGLDKGVLSDTEFRMQNKDGDYIWVNNVRQLVFDEDDNPKTIVGNVRNISERKEHEKELKKSLEDKEFLLKEIHHRLKNNLGIISSLLELQKDSVGQETVKVLSASQSRINSIAKVHEKLYKSTTLSDINMESYVEELVEEISNAYKSEEADITMELDVDPIVLDIENVIPCGLILNELINNAFKHGFKNHKEGTIRISFKDKGEFMELAVENNGDKLPEGFDPAVNQSLGMTLIKTLSKKFDAKLNIESNHWTRFQLQFGV